MEAAGSVDFDLVGVGRALLGDPDWVRTVQAGRQADLHGFSRDLLDALT